MYTCVQCGTCYIHTLILRSCTNSELHCKKKTTQQNNKYNHVFKKKQEMLQSPQTPPFPRAARVSLALGAGAQVQACLQPGVLAAEVRQQLQVGAAKPALAPLWLSNRRVG